MRRLLPLLLPLLLVAPAASAARAAFACAPGGPATSLPFCRQALPLRVRARDFVSRLTRAEKIRLLVNNAEGVPRLGVAGYEWWSEALHGVSDTGPGVKFGGAFPGATAFPQVIGTAAALNASLWELIGRVRALPWLGLMIIASPWVVAPPHAGIAAGGVAEGRRGAARVRAW
ncbi:unnamed protein product [Urochloa humidicola]